MAALINILNSNQKKGFFILTSIMVLNAILEIFTLNFIFIVFNYLSNPGSIENNFLINYFENLDSSFDISIIERVKEIFTVFDFFVLFYKQFFYVPFD